MGARSIAWKFFLPRKFASSRKSMRMESVRFGSERRLVSKLKRMDRALPILSSGPGGEFFLFWMVTKIRHTELILIVKAHCSRKRSIFGKPALLNHPTEAVGVKW